MDCGNCHVPCIYKESMTKKFDIFSIVQGFLLCLILPVLPPYHPVVNTLTSSAIEYKSNTSCDSLTIENQQQNHNTLMDVIIQVALMFSKRFFYLWTTDEAEDIVTDSTRELFWHQCLLDNVIFVSTQFRQDYCCQSMLLPLLLPLEMKSTKPGVLFFMSWMMDYADIWEFVFWEFVKLNHNGLQVQLFYDHQQQVYLESIHTMICHQKKNFYLKFS